MRSHTCCAILLVFAVTVPPLAAQLRLSEHSQLKNSQYLESQIKDISDADLFHALSLERSGLGSVERAVRQREYARAYRAWGSYWDRKKQPRYSAQTDKLLIDTDMLKGYREIRDYAKNHTAEKDSVISRASLIVRNIIRPWGDVVIDFGSRVDFNREVGQSGKYGFHYWFWSRPLITAYILTGDQKYLVKFDELFHQWYKQRNSISRSIPDFDVVYYELGLGVRNRIFLEYYLLPFENRQWQTHEEMLKDMLGAARWLYELERWEGYRSGNWQSHGCYMLAQIAMAFPEFRESPQWLNLALQLIEEHLKEDFFNDGGHSERSPRNYTQATYLTYRNMYYLLSAYHVREDLAQNIRQRMGNTIDWWVTMVAPTGEIPAINDSHRGLFPTFILLDGADFFRKPYVYGVLYNLFGLAPKTSPLTFPGFTSRNMPESGFTVMRTDWTRDALYMNINYGKWNGAHTHNDMLDFEIYAYGKALAVDAGIGLTYDDPLYIPWYKSSRAHNMVTVNDRDMKRETVQGENIMWSSSASLEYFAGEHRGYAPAGVQARRQIIFVKPRYWVVLDDLKCEKGGDTLSWYFHTPTTLVKLGGQFRSTTSPGILIAPANEESNFRTGTCMASSTSDLTPGKTEEIRWLALDQTSNAGATSRFNVLLYPFRETSASVTYTEISTHHSIVRDRGFSDDLYYSQRPIDADGISTDATFLLVHHEQGQADHFNLVEGTYLSLAGKRIWESINRTSAEGILK
jgi:hypothetical protein